VIGWAIDEHMRADLVESALAMAVAMRGELAETVIVHADSETGLAGVLRVLGPYGDGPDRMLVPGAPRAS